MVGSDSSQNSYIQTFLYFFQVKKERPVVHLTGYSHTHTPNVQYGENIVQLQITRGWDNDNEI